jgi:high-affinity K+ transport system ATPase subunit B
MSQVLTPPSSEANAHGVARARGLFDREILRQAFFDSFKKMDPRVQVRNPVMFVVLVGSVITLLEAFAHPGTFTWSITIWLFLTVMFANFAEAMAEGRGKAQADTLRKMRSETEARRLLADGREELVPAANLSKGDTVVCEAGDVIPSDGEIIEGIASVDESAITGESAPVIRESGGDRSAVTGGTKVLSDRIVVRITAERGQTFIDRMISLVEGANRQKTPNEIALTILLAVLTIVFIPVVVTLQPFAAFAGTTVSVVVLVSLLVCLIPTTIGAGAPSRPRATCRRCCSTRPAPSRWVTAWPPISSRSRVTANKRSLTSLSWRHWPTRPPKVVPSWCSPRRTSVSASANSTRATCSSPSPPPRACPGSTWILARSARAPRSRSNAG